MGGNPFSITSTDLLKKKQGVQGQDGVEQKQSTQETRKAKEKDNLQQTNVLQASNGGSMATTDGVFENYDGFQRTTVAPIAQNKEEEEASSLLDATGAATNKAKAKKSDCEDYSKAASDDEKSIQTSVKKEKTESKKMQQKVNQNTQQQDALKSENDTLKDDVDTLNDEIAELMAEDGQDYTPQEAPEAQPVAMPQAGGNAESEAAVMVSADNGDGANSGMSTNITAGSDAAGGGNNIFAMNSLPTPGQQSAAPTSTTAVAAQNSGQTQNAQAGKGQQAQQSAGKSASNAAGGSLNAFGSSLVSAKGKNADKINEKLAQLGEKNSTISSNNSSINAFTSSSLKTANSYKSFLTSSISQTNAKKSSNASNTNAAKAAQTVGQTTSLTGGVATAVGGAMLVWGDKALGAKLVAGGGIATATGTTTSAVASATQGDTQAAVKTATDGLNSLSSGFNTYNTEMDKIKNSQKTA